MSNHRKWHLRSRMINEFVHAENQFEAWDFLRNRPAEDFGLIVEAEPDENANPFLVRTTILMFRWGRDEDARKFAKLGAACGLPYTTKQDREAAKKSKTKSQS